MYQRQLKIQKGVDNTIKIQFKNSDQKRVDISDMAFFINIFDAREKSMVLQKALTVLDDGTTFALKGLAEITITAKELGDTSAQDYNFSVVQITDAGTFNPAYSSTYFDVSGIVEIKEDIFPATAPTLEIDSFQRNYNSDSNKLWWEYNTGNLRVYPEKFNRTALLTTAFYMRRFIGEVVVEGTLENEPSTYANYALIQRVNYQTPFTGIDYVNFNGMFTNIRVTYIPKKNPVTSRNDDTSYAGFFDKVQLRS